LAALASRPRTHVSVAGPSMEAPVALRTQRRQPRAASGHNMSCGFTNAFATRGVCHACGIVNRPPCESGCDPGLGVRNHPCNVCSAQGQLPCDAGCNSGLETARGLCSQCGRVGQQRAIAAATPAPRPSMASARLVEKTARLPVGETANMAWRLSAAFVRHLQARPGVRRRRMRYTGWPQP